MGGATRAPHQRQPQNNQQQNRRPEQGRGQQVQRKQQQQQSPQQQGGHPQHLGFQQSPEASPRLEQQQQEQQEFQMQDTPQQSRHQHGGGSNNQSYPSRRGDMRSRNGQGSRYHANQMNFTQPSMPNAAETMVHFHKSFGVMQEIFEYRDFTTLRADLQQCALAGAPPGQPAALRFLDLGCAPGGFSACLLQDEVLGSASMGFGVTLPPHMGGFSMGFASSRHFVQFEDIMVMEMDHLACADDSIHLCVADAQNLESFWKRANPTTRYRGVRARSQSLGIWALTVKQCKLGFAKLKHQGTFIFRFGWRGIEQDVHPTGEQVSPELLAKYQQEEEWYKALTHWLFSVLKSLFATLRPFKSEYVHQADVSFYMVCHQFDRRKYEVHDWEAKLQRAFDELMDCSDEAELVAALANAISDNVKEEIDNLLSIVGRMRAIGINSRKITNPKSFTARWEEKRDDKEEGGKSGKPLNSSKEGDDAEDGACAEVSVQSNDASVKAEGEGASSAGRLSSPLDAIEQAATASVATTAPRQDDTADSADHSSEAAGATQDTDIGALCGTSVAGGSCASSMGAAAADATSTSRSVPEGSAGGGRQETNGRQFRGRQSEYARQRRCRRPPLVYTVINGHIVAVDASTVAALECESQYQQDIHIQRFQDQLKEQQHVMQAYQQPDHQAQFDQQQQQQQHTPSSSPMTGELQQASLPLASLAGSSPMAAMSPEAHMWTPSGASPTDFYSQPSMAGAGCMEEYMVFNPEQAFLSDQNRFHIGDPYQANHHYMGEDAYHGCEPYAADGGWAGGAWAGPAAGADAIQATSMQWHTPAIGSLEATIVPPPPSEPPRLPAEALSEAALLPPPPPSAPAKASKPVPLLERRHPAAAGSSSSSCPTVPMLNGKVEAVPDPRRDNSVASIASTASAPAALAGRNKRGSRADLPRREVSEKVLEGDTFMSSDDDINDSSGRGYRHKRRAGRLVRERRQGRKARNTALVSASTASETTLKERFLELCRELWQQLEGDVLEALRFGLVCAMAWMLLSIAISVLKLLRGEAR